MNHDLTSGKVGTVLLKYTVPLFISTVFQQLYNIADSAIAGRFAGEAALAAIGASYPITMIFIAIATGSSMGCTVVISQLFGAKREKKVKTAAYTALIFGVAVSVFLTFVSLLFSKLMLKAINTPSAIFEDASVYLNVYFLGYIFIFLYNMANGVFTALGDSATPLYLLIFSSIGNIILDLLFVPGFKLGVAGAAWATFIAQGIACVLSVVLVLLRLKRMSLSDTSDKSAPIADNKHGNGEEARVFLWSWNLLGIILGVALPSILQNSFVSVGTLMIQALVNRCGEATIAGFSAAIKLNTFAIMSLTTMTNGISAFTAQNIGAAKLERVKRALGSALIIAFSICALFFIAYFFFGEFALSLFLEDKSTVALSVGLRFLKGIAIFYTPIAAKLMIDGVFKGAKALRYFIISTFIDLLLRVILAFALFNAFEIDGIMIAWVSGWCISCILSVTFYFTGGWKKHALQ